MPWRAMSIIPDDSTAPSTTATEARMSTVRKVATRAPTARLQEVHSIVAHTYEQVKDCQTEQKDDDTQINCFHKIVIFFLCAKLQ